MERLNAELELEVQRLSELISAEVKDCKIGPWCKDCKHIGRDMAIVTEIGLMGYRFIKESGGEVQYCKKHLHNICQEFDRS